MLTGAFWQMPIYFAVKMFKRLFILKGEIWWYKWSIFLINTSYLEHKPVMHQVPHGCDLAKLLEELVTLDGLPWDTETGRQGANEERKDNEVYSQWRTHSVLTWHPVRVEIMGPSPQDGSSSGPNHPHSYDIPWLQWYWGHKRKSAFLCSVVYSGFTEPWVCFCLTFSFFSVLHFQNAVLVWQQNFFIGLVNINLAQSLQMGIRDTTPLHYEIIWVIPGAFTKFIKFIN